MMIWFYEGPFLYFRLINITPSNIITRPDIWIGVTCSCPSTTPKRTAMNGLTYACVPTSVAGRTFSSQTYAE